MMEFVDMKNLTPRVRINRATLGNHIGKGVILLGTVEKGEPNDVMVEVKAADNQHIMVQMNKPLGERLFGIAEFHGIAVGTSEMKAEHYVMFPADCEEEFNMDQYNKTVMLINTIPNDWNVSKNK